MLVSLAPVLPPVPHACDEPWRGAAEDAHLAGPRVSAAAAVVPKESALVEHCHGPLPGERQQQRQGRELMLLLLYLLLLLLLLVLDDEEG